ncbi:MAG: hypothetical protein IPM29_12835 [Planctomycetes bacterium]|nr:hypothetical protein [Planctomycetota bacterium]
MTDPRIQGDELEFDDEFVLDDIEHDEDLFADPTSPPARTSEPAQPEPVAGPSDPPAQDPLSFELRSVEASECGGHRAPAAVQDDFADLSFEDDSATVEELLAHDYRSATPSETFGSDQPGFRDDGGGRWGGRHVPLPDIVGEDTEQDASLFDADESGVDDYDEVEIVHVDETAAGVAADGGGELDFDAQLDGLDTLGALDGLGGELLERLGDSDAQDPFADLEFARDGEEPPRDDARIDLAAYGIDPADGKRTASAEPGLEAAFGALPAAEDDDWDLTVRDEGPSAEPATRHQQTDWNDESFVLLDGQDDEPSEADSVDAVPSGGFGGGRRDTFYAQGDEGFAEHELAAEDDAERGDGLDTEVFAGEFDEAWEISEETPDEAEEELDDGIYGRPTEAVAPEYTYGPDDTRDLRELEETYYEDEPEVGVRVVGAGPRRRVGFARLAAAAAALLIVGAGTVAIVDPSRFGLGDDTALVERIAVARPSLPLEVPEPVLAVETAPPADVPPVAQGGTDTTPGTPATPTTPDVPVTPDGQPPIEVGPIVPPTGPVAGPLGPAVPGGVTPIAGPTGQEVRTTPPEDQPFDPLPVGEEMEIRGAQPAPPLLADAVEPGVRAWAQLTNESVFVGTVRKIDASFVTLELATGEVTLERRSLAALQPLSEGGFDALVEIEHGFVQVQGRGTLLGRVLRNEGSDAVVLATADGRVTIPHEDLGQLGVRTATGVVVIDDDDAWLESRARRRLQRGDTELGDAPQRSGQPAASPPAGQGAR